MRADCPCLSLKEIKEDQPALSELCPVSALCSVGIYGVRWEGKQGLSPGAADHPSSPAFCQQLGILLRSKPTCPPQEPALQ